MRHALQLYTQSMFVMLVWIGGEPYFANTWACVERIIGEHPRVRTPIVEVFPRYTERTMRLGPHALHFFGGLRQVHGRPFGEWDGIDPAQGAA